MGESTRKNPDKLIKQLKNRIEFLENQMDIDYENFTRNRESLTEENARLKGTPWIEEAEESFTITVREDLGAAVRLGQKFLIGGRITDYTRTTDEEYPHQIDIAITDVSLKED